MSLKYRLYFLLNYFIVYITNQVQSTNFNHKEREREGIGIFHFRKLDLIKRQIVQTPNYYQHYFTIRASKNDRTVFVGQWVVLKLLTEELKLQSFIMGLTKT